MHTVINHLYLNVPIETIRQAAEQSLLPQEVTVWFKVCYGVDVGIGRTVSLCGQGSISTGPA